MIFLKRTNKFFLIFAILFFLFGSFLSVQARDFEINYPQIGNISLTEDPESLPEYIKYIFKLSIAVIGIFALGGLIYSGVLYLTSLGNPDQMKKATSAIKTTLIGLLILLSSYLVLERINPELTKIEQREIEAPETTTYDKFELPKEITSVHVSLPMETRVKGREEESFGLFQEKRLERIKGYSVDSAKEASKGKKTSEELVSLSGKCTCTHTKETCNGYTCTYPVCAGICTLQTHEEEDPNNPGETITEEECVNMDCRGLCCTSDPCCCQRKEIDENKEKNRSTIKELQNLKRNLSLEKIELEKEVDKIKETLKIMEEDCPLSGVLSRDNFISLKDHYISYDETPKEVNYWDDIERLLPMSYADFYCPVGGTRLGFTLSDPEIPSQEETDQYLEAFQSHLETAPFDYTISAQFTIPFGDVIDRGLFIANKLINKISSEDEADSYGSSGCSCQGGEGDEGEELPSNLKGKGLVELNSEMIKEIDNLHLAINKCLSTSCTPICECEDSGCSCKPTYCIGGNPCPMGEISSVLDKIKDIQKAIEKRKNEIVKIIDEEIPHYIEDFDEMAGRMHNCIADPEEIEMGWLLLNCEKAIGSIGPDGKIITDKEGNIDEFFEEHLSFAGGAEGSVSTCQCSTIEECVENFEHLMAVHENCQVVENCYDFNFFCGRIKE